MNTELIEKLFTQQFSTLDTIQQRVVSHIVAEVNGAMKEAATPPQPRSFVSAQVFAPLLSVNEFMQQRVIECVRLKLYVQGIYAKSESIEPAPASGVPTWKYRASLFPQDVL